MSDFSMLDKDYPERSERPSETTLDEIKERLKGTKFPECPKPFEKVKREEALEDGRRQVAINLLNNWRFNENIRKHDPRAEVEADHLLEEILQLMGVDS